MKLLARSLLLLALALALTGCASTAHGPDHGAKVLPCMAGGLLCSPKG